MYAGGELVICGEGPRHVLEAIGDGWEECGAQNDDLEVRVASDPPHSSECLLNIGLGCFELGDATVVDVEVYA